MRKKNKQTEHEQRSGDSRQENEGMILLSEREERHYTTLLPEAVPPLNLLFPARVTRGLGLGALAGSVVGVLLGLLLRNNILVISGWEALY